MESKDNYNVTIKEYKKTPIEKIIFDKGMKHIANEKMDDICKNRNIKVLKNSTSISLNRWDSMSDAFKENIELDPVKLKSYKNKDLYEIIDGRHRVMMSYYFNYKYIPYILMDEL